MGEFGFSAVGAVFLAALFIPNLLWTRAQPRGYDPAGEPRGLRVVERIGQVATTASALVFSDTSLHPWTPWSLWLVAAVVLMVTYEVCWVRYFRSPRTLADFYGPFVPLASLPVTAFLLLGVYGRLLPLVVSACVLGIGHIGIHVVTRRSTARP